MKKWLLLILLFLVFLVATAPARFVYQLLPESEVKAYGLSDSIWSGYASRIEVDQQTLHNVNWDLNPLLLVMAKLGGGVTISDTELTADGSWQVGFDNTLTLSDMNIKIPATKIQHIVPVPGVALNGDIRIDIEHLQFNQETGPSKVNATVYWLRGAASLAGNSVKLGNFTLDITSLENNQIQLSLKPTQNVFDAKGSAIVTWPNNLELDVNVTDDVPAQLKNAVAFLKKGQNNRRELKMSLPLSL